MSDTVPEATASPAAPPDRPAPSENDLDKTLNLLATAVASISNRVDAQTKVLEQVNETATEARFAAFEAQKQTNPAHYGEVVYEAIDERVGQITGRLVETADRNLAVLAQAEEDNADALKDVWEREERLDRWKRRLPWIGLVGLVVVLALSVVVPRFLAGNAQTCRLMGGVWQETTTSGEVCVFYGE